MSSSSHPPYDLRLQRLSDRQFSHSTRPFLRKPLGLLDELDGLARPEVKEFVSREMVPEPRRGSPSGMP